MQSCLNDQNAGTNEKDILLDGKRQKNQPSFNVKNNIAQQYTQVYKQIQKYNFKSNLLSCGIIQKDYQFYSQFQLQKVRSKYQQLYQKLQQIMKDIKIQFQILQANELRSINNVLKAYKNRVRLDEKEVTKMKIVKQGVLDEDERWVLEQLILDPFRYQQQAAQRLLTISQTIKSLTLKLQQSINSQKQQQPSNLQPSIPSPSSTNISSQLINVNYINQIETKILNQTSIHLHPLYQKFQNNLLAINTTFQQEFESMNEYLNKFQQICVNRCFQQIKTQKQKQMERFIKEYESRQQVGGLFGYQHGMISHGVREYKQFDRQFNYNNKERALISGEYFSNNNNNIIPNNRHINNIFTTQDMFLQSQNKQLSTTTKQRLSKQKDRSKLGRMFNKKKGKSSIVTNNKDKKSIDVHYDWCYGVDGQQVEFDQSQIRQINDQWKRYYEKNIIQEYQRNNNQHRNGNNYYHHHKDRHDYYDSSYGINKQYNNNNNSYYHNDNNLYNYSYNHYDNHLYNYNNNNNQYQSIQQILQHTYPSPGDIQSFYCYDQYGSNQTFSLIHPLSNMVQNRIIFESSHEIQVYRKLQSINQHIKQNQIKVEKYKQDINKKEKRMEEKLSRNLNKQSINIIRNKNVGIKLKQTVQDKGLNQDIIQKSFNQTQKLSIDKQIIQGLNKTIQIEKQPSQMQQNGKQIKPTIQVSKRQIQVQIKNINILTVKDNDKDQQKHLVSLQQQQQHSLNQQQKHSNQCKITTIIKPPQFQPTLLSLIVQSYFTTIQQKYSRLAKQQKSLKVFYFPSLQQTHWQYLKQQIVNIQRIFIVIQSPVVVLIKMEKFYTLQKELIKLIVYEIGEEMEERNKEELRIKVKEVIYNDEVVTFLFKLVNLQTVSKQQHQQIQVNTFLIYQLQMIMNHKTNTSQQQQQQHSITSQLNSTSNLLQTKCLLGMLFVLIYQQKVLQKDSLYTLVDYLTKGQQLIDQYQCFYFEQKENTQIQTYTNKQLLFKRVYENPNISKINYFFDQQSQQGVVFAKLVDVTNLVNNKEQEVEVFKVNGFKEDGEQQGGEQMKEKNSDSDYGDNVNVNGQQEEREEQKKDTNITLSILTATNDNLELKQQILQPPINPIQQQLRQVQHKISHSQIRDFNQILLKRSNSRQELKHFNRQQSLFVIDINLRQSYHYYNDDRQQKQQATVDDKYQQKQQQQTQVHMGECEMTINKNQYEMMINNNQQLSGENYHNNNNNNQQQQQYDYYDDNDQDQYVGL